MDVFAVKQACKFAKDHAVANGPIVRTVKLCLLLIFWSMHTMLENCCYALGFGS
jgi:hypothetical protein